CFTPATAVGFHPTYCFGHPTSNMVNCVTIDKGDRVPVSPQQLLLGFTQPTVSDILHRTW
ncbi:hypothetical protein, partial [Limnospira sp. PMC 1240.20]|uniref:hypothetical protein n=1 Tax=Limnospira sp. PMC 1240.20 TaxID=2981038 RepID=UPI0028E6B78A